MPLGVLTVTSTVAAAVTSAEVAPIWVEEATVKLSAAAVPKLTAVAAVKPVPVMVSAVPPPSGPARGLMVVTDGNCS